MDKIEREDILWIFIWKHGNKIHIMNLDWVWIMRIIDSYHYFVKNKIDF